MLLVVVAVAVALSLLATFDTCHLRLKALTKVKLKKEKVSESVNDILLMISAAGTQIVDIIAASRPAATITL